MSELESAKYWLSWIEFGGKIALLFVALGVGYEFVEGMLAAPLRKTIEDARQHEIVELQTQNAQLNHDTARLKAQALEDEKLMADRRVNFCEGVIVKDDLFVPGVSVAGVNPVSFGRLSTFSGVKLVINVVPEFEAVKFAIDLGQLRNRGWDVSINIENLQNALRIMDGAHLYSWRPPPPAPLPAPTLDSKRWHIWGDPYGADLTVPELKAWAAAEALRNFLKAGSEIEIEHFSGSVTHPVAAPLDTMPKDTVLLQIGSKDVSSAFWKRKFLEDEKVP